MYKQDAKGRFGHIAEPHQEVLARKVRGGYQITHIDGCGCGCKNKTVLSREIFPNSGGVDEETGYYESTFPHKGPQFKKAVEKFSGCEIGQFHLTSTRNTFRGIVR